MAKDSINTPMMDGVNLDSLPRWQRDLIDLANESASRETGRSKRFLSSDHPDGHEAQEREKERRFNALMRRLLDPDYARLYGQATDIVTRAEDAAERAAARIARDSEIASERLEILRSEAAELPDGRKVYAARNGRIYAEDGSDVTALKEQIRGLSKDSPSWEDYKSARKRADELERQRIEIEEYRQDVIDPAKERLSDRDNPPSEEELQQIMERIDEKMPKAVRAEYETAILSQPELSSSKSAADQVSDLAPLNAPDLSLEFKAAHDGSGGPSAAPAPASSLQFRK